MEAMASSAMPSTGPPYAIADWQAAAREKREQLWASIPIDFRLPEILAEQARSSTGLRPEDPAVLSCGILSPLDIEITSLDDVTVLIHRLAHGIYSAVQVLNAFSKRAAIAQQCTGCLTELMYESALSRAHDLDSVRTSSSGAAALGPLHGLPVSLKDCYDVKGVNTNAGLVSWLPYRASRHSSVAQALEAAGAILYAKTSSSQALLMVESINNIFGTVKNPHNLALSVGGSSGGEGALLAARGSILGSGTDGGGSLRFPAAFCGVCEFPDFFSFLPTIDI